LNPEDSYQSEQTMKNKAQVNDELVNKTIASGRKYCVRLYKSGPNRNQADEDAEKIQAEHQRYLMQLRLDGILLIGGPVVDDSELKGVGIFNTSDKEEVKRLSDNDPAVMTGRLVYEIYHWFGLPGDGLKE